MVSAHNINGDGSEWPNLDVAVDLPEPKEHYSDREMAQTYATLAIHHGMLWPRVKQALEYLKEHFFAELGRAHRALEGSSKAMEEHSKEVRLLREAVLGQRAAETLKLPTMRPEAPSTIDMAESIKKKISGEFGKIALETKGPHVETDPRRLVDVVGRAVDEEFAKREAAQKAKKDADELDARRQADVERKKRNRRYLKLAVAAFITSLAGGFGTWTAGRATGHLEAHAEAVDEVKKTIAAQAVATTMVAPPKAPAATAPAR